MIYLNNEKVIPTIFPDKTSQIWKIDQIDEKKEFNIKWKFEDESELFHLAQLVKLIQSYGFDCSLYLPYLPYGRQDKFISNESTFALKVFSDIINDLNIKNIDILDPHSEMALAFIRNSKAIYPIKDVRKVFEKENIDCICYPDNGAYNKYLSIYKHIDDAFGRPVVGHKVRDQRTGWIKSFELTGEFKGKNVLIIDDICDGGATFNILAKSMRESNCPNKISLFVTHGLFSQGVSELKNNIDNIFIPGYVISEYGNRFSYIAY